LTGSHYAKAEASPGFLFWRSFNEWSRRLRLELEKITLTQVQYSILAAISYLGSTAEEVSQQQVSNQLSMDKMMVSDVAKALEGRGLLVRRAHSRDGRAVALSLTAKGNGLLKDAIPMVEAIDDAFFGKLTTEQLQSLKRCLIALAKPATD